MYVTSLPEQQECLYKLMESIQQKLKTSPEHLLFCKQYLPVYKKCIASILPYDLCKYCDQLLISIEKKNEKIKKAYKEKEWNIDQHRIDLEYYKKPNITISNNGHYFAYSFSKKNYSYERKSCIHMMRVLEKTSTEMSTLKNKEFIHFSPDSAYYIVEHSQGATLNYFSSPLSNNNPYLITKDNPNLATKYHTSLQAKKIIISNNSKYILLPREPQSFEQPFNYYELWVIDTQGIPQETPLKNTYGHPLLSNQGAVIFHPDNQHIMYHDRWDDLELYNIETKQQKTIFKRKDDYNNRADYLTDPIITPDNKKLLLKRKKYCSDEEDYILFNIETTDDVKPVIIPPQSCHKKEWPKESNLPILYIPHNNMFTHITNEGNRLNLLNEKTEVIASHKAKEGTYITALAVDSTGYYVASGYSDGTIMIWNVFSKNPECYEKIFINNDGPITSLTFGDNQLLLSQSISHTITYEYTEHIKYQYGSAILWDIHGNKIIDFGDNLTSIMSPNGKTIVTVPVTQPHVKYYNLHDVHLSSYTLDENTLQDLCNKKNKLTLAQLYELVHATTDC
jgi:WD40 repeat protein